VKATIAVLQKLSKEILPALLECQRVRRAPAAPAIEHLKYIHGRWDKEMQYLSRLVDDITDMSVFTEATG